MKKTLTLLALMIAVAGCKEGVTTETLVIKAYSAGWRTGANVVTKMLNDGSYDYDKLMLRHYKDSVEFAKLIDKP